MSEQITRGIRVRVETQYLAEHSNPQRHQYVFAYHVTISNEGTETTQLVSRHWIITDSNGHVEEVKGPGVVGKQPMLQPGEAFDYTSSCPLKTQIGTMHGTYKMVTNRGEWFDAEIPSFTLSEPFAYN